MTHILVTNDYPPKVGGIQNYLWELYRRLPADEFAVLTSPYEGDAAFDRDQHHQIERFHQFWLSPTPAVRSSIEDLIAARDASFVLFDPAVPVGWLGPQLSVPYGVVLHGAEVTIPARLPAARTAFRRTLEGASLVVSASNYALGEAEALVGRSLDSVYVPPGVDVDRFVPTTPAQRAATRRARGIAPDAPFIMSLSRLVPRKGMDVLIDASARLAAHHPGLTTLIAGSGRDTRRLARRIDRTGAPVTLLGRVPEEELRPLLASADVFAMLCRRRWGGLEQEGFGIVFLEAAASGVVQVAGRSGGAGEAVDDGVTGLIVDDPTDADESARAIDRLLQDREERVQMGTAARARAVREFSYDLLAARLLDAIHRVGG